MTRVLAITIVDLPPSPPSPPRRPSRPCFRLSPSQQAYLDAQVPTSPCAEEARQPAGRGVRVESEGKELMQGVMEARKAAAGLKKGRQEGTGASWRSQVFAESFEDVTAGALEFHA
ncbi:hypothetical protein GUITHDRAFT_102367 [Guillardia theta CCMP2712]|uniref:Uncharacterized protein n=1 Tax=Guillardia theta (strain CCMP2712) TaxID=905079 RepID=L1JU90_GUITC|nr:hypothetical protein GUITHDRAFT_102367 [Guillardia theta CCMP2712]EKX51760.1 hypothetical protein GUITHDRAFT_102367 [Guillardia theta CCMP2712]|eukprot:XP_005838740.1 hypothetical protein GUITHDRAFT_102367 [Guillardia theta CCMP2712]